MPAGSRADYREISLTSARVRRRGPSKDHETGWFHQSAGAPSRQSIPRDPLPAKWRSFWQSLWRYIWRILRSSQVFVYHCFTRFSTTNLAGYLATSLAGLAVRQSSQRKGHPRWRVPRLAVDDNFFQVFSEVWIEDWSLARFLFVRFCQRDALRDATA